MMQSDPEEKPSSLFQSIRAEPSEGRLLGLLVAAAYIFLTLLPGSNSLVVSWPWVFIWQVGLMTPVVWWLWLLWHQRRLQWLGHGLDWLAGLTAIVLLGSASFAEFPAQAHWYSWAGLCFLAALYALNQWLQTTQRRYWLLLGQGYLHIAFIGISLWLWTTTAFLPELARLKTLEQDYGVRLAFDFNILTLRNWHPLGHQNYVAGYLLLALPVLVGLSALQSGWRRWLWLVGTGLGLIDLYTTSSRGGWLGLLVAGLVGFVLLLVGPNAKSQGYSRRWIGLAGLSTAGVLGLILLTNSRLQMLIINVLGGRATGELGYRMITTLTGWRMGLSHLWTGVGLGGVPLVYQQYRPSWAGQEAEMAYQLHNTPAHLWAELGIWGAVLPLAAIAVLIYLGIRWFKGIGENPAATVPSDRILTISIYSGLCGYGIFSLTDYQLDNVCISGTLVIFVAFLASELRPTADAQPVLHPSLLSRLTPKPRLIALLGLGTLLSATSWLIPVHQAWKLSSEGFQALDRQDTPTFAQRLSQAHQLAAWEPYYPYQLGWYLANLSYKVETPQQQRQLQQAGIFWLRKGVELSPYQEFGHSNLAWMLVNSDPKLAAQHFARSAQLMPAKRGVFFGLGFSLLLQNRVDLGVEALALEVLRDPMFISSNLWKAVPRLQAVYPQVLERLQSKYTTLLQQHSSDPLTNYLHQCRGGLAWWQGNLQAARSDWATDGSPISLLVLDLAEGKPVQAKLQQTKLAAGTQVIAAWLDPTQRLNHLRQAWITAPSTLQAWPELEQKVPKPETLAELQTGMANANTFDQWLKQKAPAQQYRRERIGFGILSRHIDGVAPVDFLPVIDNLAMNKFFSELLPTQFYAPDLDVALQPWRDDLLQTVLPAHNS